MTTIESEISVLELFTPVASVSPHLRAWAAARLDDAKARLSGATRRADTALRISDGEGSWRAAGGPDAVVVEEITRRHLLVLQALADGRTQIGNGEGQVMIADLRNLSRAFAD